VLKTNRVRADTIVVEANPSDAGLLAKGVAKMAAPARGLQAMGFATRTRLADRTRSVRARARLPLSPSVEVRIVRASMM
jgi:IS5 family transposase